MNNKNEILATPGVSVLRIKKNAPVESGELDASIFTREAKTDTFYGAKKRRGSLAPLTINLFLIAAVLFGFNFFIRKSVPSGSIGDYSIGLIASIKGGGVLCAVNISRTGVSHNEISDISVRFYNDYGQSVVAVKPPLKPGENASASGLLDSYKNGEPVFAEVWLGTRKLVLNVYPASGAIPKLND